MIAGYVLWGLSAAGLVVVTAVVVGRVHRHRRLHRRRANKLFMAGYRAAFRQFAGQQEQSSHGVEDQRWTAR